MVYTTTKINSSKKVFFNSIIYTASGLLLKCFSMFLLPLYTSYLTTEDYGITNISNNFISTVIFIVSFSLFSAIMRFYVDLKDNPVKLKRFYGTIVLFVSIVCIIFALLAFACKALLERYVFSGMNFYPVIFVTLISLFFNCQHNIYDNILRSQQKAMKASILSIIYFFTTVGFNILFVVFLKLGAIGVILATALSATWYTIYFWIDTAVKKEIQLCLDFSLLKSALKYSIPIMPHNLSAHLAVLLSSVLIGNAHSLSDLGVYSVATQFGNMSDTIQSYVNQAYAPWLYEKLKAGEDGYKKTINRTVNLLCQAVGLFLIGISLFAHDYIVLFVNKEYCDAWKYVVLIVMVYTIKTAYYFYVNVLFYYKRASKKIFIATLTSSLINVFLSFFLIPLWGVYGSILADAISMIIRVVIVIIISKQFEDIGLKIKNFILNIFTIYLFIAVGMLPSFLKYQNEFSFVNFLYKILVVLVYVGIFAFAQRKQLSKFLTSALKRFKR